MRILSIRDITQEENQKIEKSNRNWYKICGGKVIEAAAPIDNKRFSFLYEAKVSISDDTISIYKFGKQYVLNQNKGKCDETSVFIGGSSDLSQECEKFADVVFDYLRLPFMSFKSLNDIKDEINERLDCKRGYTLTKTRKDV